MKLRAITVSTLLGFAVPIFSQQSYPVWYDTHYDQSEASINSVECSNFLLIRGFKIFGDIPTWPFIAGAPQIQGQDSPSCGSCWEFSYIDGEGIDIHASFLAINDGKNNPDGFTIPLGVMNFITGGIATSIDGQIMTLKSLPSSDCGLY